jgi:plasmid replication initiation protein
MNKINTIELVSAEPVKFYKYLINVSVEDRTETFEVFVESTGVDQNIINIKDSNGILYTNNDLSVSSIYINQVFELIKKHRNTGWMR